MNDSPEKKNHKPDNTFFKDLRIYFREYCNCTSVHGFRYFGEKRTIFERVWWFIIFVICLSACLTAIYVVYEKWERSPVIVNFANRAIPIYKIPFPAVTVCPESKADQDRFNYTEIMHKKLDGKPITSLENYQFEYMSLICNYDPSYLNYTNNDTFSEEFYDVVDEVKSEFLIMSCRHMGEKINCGSSFIPIMTDEGVCYTFNMLNRDEIFRDDVMHYGDYHKFPNKSTNWSMEYGYTADAGINPYPRRALLPGIKNGLTFWIQTIKEDLDYACKDSLQGYRVLVHDPTTLPVPSQEYFRIPLDQSVVGAIFPSMITTSEAVKAYDPKKRRCYFPTERHLRFFKIYNSVNCQMECLTNYTLYRCECVNFFMPRENGTKICGTGKARCMWETEKMMQMKDLQRKLELSKSARKKISKVDCQCLPVCSDLNYDVETSQTDWDWNKLVEVYRIKLPTNGSRFSSLTLFFKSDNFITSERNELYGPIDFLANFGGILGLFTGFSVLSFIEILYFLSLRIIFNKRLYGRWAGPET